MNWNDFAVWHSPEEVIALASDEHASVCPKDLLNLTLALLHQICFEGGAELEAIANAALDSVARDGIGCTAQLEHAMDKAATGICRKLLSAILQSEAAKAKYSPKPGERNAGTKSIDVVSMFGPVGTISRTY